MTSDLTSIPPRPIAQRGLPVGAAGPHPDPAATEQYSPGRWRRKKKKPETRAARRERLDRAAGEAIVRAAETGGDPVALMAAASGTEAKYCDPVIRQHPLFFSELRARFLMPEERQRSEREERMAAAVAAEPGPVVWVRRQFNGRRRRAAYRIADVSGLHWSSRSGGKRWRANRPYLHGYVWCDAMIVGEVAHSCRHGPPPHRIKVCITKIDNKRTWPEIERAALHGTDDLSSQSRFPKNGSDDVATTSPHARPAYEVPALSKPKARTTTRRENGDGCPKNAI